MIDDNMLSQVDPEKNYQQVLNNISNNSEDGSAFKMSDGFIRSIVGNLYPNKATKGWKLKVKWKYGSLI